VTEMAGIAEDRLIAKRVLKLVYMGIVILVFGAVMGVVHSVPLGDNLAMALADILFALLFVFYLESDRIHGKEEPDSAEDFQRVLALFSAGALVTVGISFFPAYTAPVLLVSFLLSAGLKRDIALVIAVFFDMQMAVAADMPDGMVVCYLLLTILGSMLCAMHQVRDYRRYSEMAALAFSVAVPALFYYLAYGDATLYTFVFSFVSGALSMLGMHFLYDRIHYRQVCSQEISLDTIVDSSYHLVQEIKRYSQVDYNHAIRVSRIAAHCAANVNADVKTAAVGGFYYRLGKLGGEPVIENGVRIAQDNCFPNVIISILSEYNGELNAISTIESAIVHITDTLVTKFELLDHNTLSSSWNRDIVIYQTLNDKSSSGIYDDSGLTMNQFLKIREYLAKEEELL